MANIEEDDERECTGCGAPASSWRDKGFVSQTGDVYCCEDCAMGRQCDCERREKSPHVREAG